MYGTRRRYSAAGTLILKMETGSTNAEVEDTNNIRGEDLEEEEASSNNDNQSIINDKNNIVEDLEQRVHELDCKLRQVREERNQVILDNEELQEQLDMSNSAQSAGNVKLNELKNEMIKVTEDMNRLECICTTQEHELKTLSDKLIDLNSVKETVKELNEDTKQFKEDFNRMRTHLNVAAKLELQTQEKMYESRLHHLENVLEEMRQREGHFMRLAEETAVLKDQVDALRELSVISLKSTERYDGSGNVHHNSTEDEEAKAHAAIAAANAAHYAALMDSCSGSSMPQVMLAQSPSVMSEDNTLAKEMMGVANASPHLQTSASFTGMMPESKDYEVTEVTASEPTITLPSAPDENTNEPEANNNNGVATANAPDANDSASAESDEGIEEDDELLSEMREAAAAGPNYDNAKLKLLEAGEDGGGGNDGNAKQGIKVSGTLKLTSRDPLVDHRDKDRLHDHSSVGCFPSCVLTVWGTLFD